MPIQPLETEEQFNQKQRLLYVRHKYKLSEKQYTMMLSQQHHCCDICRHPFVRTPHVDHCHLTNKVRGLLCKKCNTAIGLLGDDVAMLKQAIKYLNKHCASTLV
jgi:hypothetical protein